MKAWERLQKEMNQNTSKFNSEMYNIDRTKDALEHMLSGLCGFLSEKWKDDAEILQIINKCLIHKLGFHLPPVPKIS